MQRIVVATLALVVLAGMPRAHAEPSRDQILAVYRQAVQKQGLSPDDFAVGLAMFLTGCYMAYFDADAPSDAQTLKLIDTLRPSSEQIASKLSAQERKTTLEHLIVTGTGLLIQRMQRPDAARAAALRAEAARHLKSMNIEPATLQTMFSTLGSTSSQTPAPAAPAAPATPARKDFEVERGKGIGDARVVAFLHTWWSGGTQAYNSETYVLFDDGTARLVPDIALDSFDAAAERTAKPDRWGRWQRSGATYALQMGKAKTFTVPQHPEVYKPGRADETFAGTFASHTSGFNRYHSSYFTLDASRRFTTSWRGGVSSPGVAGDFGTPNVSTTYTQDGTATTVSGSNVAGGSHRANPNPQADRQGTYRIDGYVIELRYDSGRIERRPFCVSPTRKELGIGASTYWLEK